MNKDNKKKFLPEKYEDISAYSFTTYNNELVISFDGFKNQAAIDYNRTKKPEFETKWYELIKKFNASYNSLYSKKGSSLYT